MHIIKTVITRLTKPFTQTYVYIYRATVLVDSAFGRPLQQLTACFTVSSTPNPLYCQYLLYYICNLLFLLIYNGICWLVMTLQLYMKPPAIVLWSTFCHSYSYAIAYEFFYYIICIYIYIQTYTNSYILHVCMQQATDH